MAENGRELQVRRVGRRDWRVIAALEIGMVSVLSAGFFILLWIFRSEFTSEPAMSIGGLLAALGAGASSSLLGALGVVATVQLACFIAIVSGQIFHQDGVEESRLRSMLSLISLGAVAAVGPAVLAVSFHSAGSLERSGLLLVVLPVYVLQLAISTAIGTFEVGDDETLRDFALERVARARQQISRLEGHGESSRWSAVLVVLVLMAIASSVTLGIVVAVPGLPEMPALINAVLALSALGAGLSVWMLGLVVANCQLKLSARGVDVGSAIVLVLLVVIWYLFCLLLVVVTYWPLAMMGAVMFFAFCIVTVMSVVEANRARNGTWPRRRPLPVVGTVALLGTREALESARKMRASAQKSADKRSRSIAENRAMHLRDDPAGEAAAPSDLAPRPRKGSRFRRALEELVR